jgi:glutathione peroxidase-family protein
MLDQDNPNQYVYLRRYNDEVLLVINSFSSHKTTYDISSYEILECVLSNYHKTQIKDHIIHLKPYESVVFKVKEKS